MTALSPEYCFLDFETRSAIDLKKTGTYVYAEDPSTDIWCCAYAFGEGSVKLWTPDKNIPSDLAEHVTKGGVLIAHNAAFERVIWGSLLTPRYQWPEWKMEQWRCTMAMALAMSLPGSLQNAAGAAGLSIEKDMQGHRLMMRMAQPRKRNQDGSLVWWDAPERKARLYEYCKTDVVVERELFRRLLPLSEKEQKLWFLDQRINDRGVLVDQELCVKAKKVVAEHKTKMDAALARVTSGLVTTCTAVADLTAWINSRGVTTQSIAKGALGDLLARGDLPDDVRQALEIRQEAGKASVAKINALLSGRNIRSGRAQGLLQFHAASTGRWAGRRFQPQNLKRPDEETDIDSAIRAILSGASASAIEAFFGPPLSIVGDCIRGMVCADDANELIFGDFVSIEAVVLAWLAGEQWKLQAFRDYRTGKAPDLYVQGYCKAFGVPLFDKKDPRRKTGKVMELASGYQGGHGAYLRMGATGKTLEALTDLVYRTADFELWETAAKKYQSNNIHRLAHDPWVALRITIDKWRDAHPKIRAFWRELEDAALEAIRHPGRKIEVGEKNGPLLRFRKAGSFLWLQLPSGRCLCYPYPRIGIGEFGHQQVVHKGVDVYTRKWQDCWLYGGLLAENVTQAVSRDFLAEAIVRLEAAGYPVILHVHDEAGAEVRKGFGSLDEFVRIMETVPEWGNGCPVAVDGWKGKRYRK